eukprot:Hpha_TRINITY_DN19714_c0_g1::TRINITY_DN19714_c0_g1_i1::g.21715::m.21715
MGLLSGILGSKAVGKGQDVPDVCGNTCAQTLKFFGPAACDLTWKDGCTNKATHVTLPAPQGFTNASTVAQLCPQSCGAIEGSLSDKDTSVHVKGVRLMRDVSGEK